MALRNAWCMKNPTSSNPTRVAPNAPAGTQAPHSNWPDSLHDGGLAFNILEKYLTDHPDDGCHVNKYSFEVLQHKLLWWRNAVIVNTADLKRSVKAHVSSITRMGAADLLSTVFPSVVTTLGAEALRILGHHLHITPRFFNCPPTMVSTGNTVEDWVVDNKLGLCDIITEVFYIVQCTWGSFLQEAEGYLKVLSKTCVENDLSPAEQLTYTRELHKVAPLWVETRRRIIVAKDTAKQMSIHPFCVAADAQHSIRAIYKKASTC
ncbi:hypothetical protein VTL71DRAFT_4028 [Oculimacula yallundae]|uniref:Uncharacterized protein n=1 Tax=Oculimacula yallundae TaxID=86028 RepID=A0ABR4C4M9_9HELO